MTFAPVGHAYRCLTCDHRWYYTKLACPNCRNDNIETYKLDAGVAESITIVHATPKGVRSPNRLAIARFDGIGVVAQVADTDPRLTAGDSVRFADGFVLKETDSEKITGSRLIAI